MPDVDGLNYDLYASILAATARSGKGWAGFWDAYKIKRKRKLFFDSGQAAGLRGRPTGELLGVEMAALVEWGGRIDEIGMSVFIGGQEVL